MANTRLEEMDAPLIHAVNGLHDAGLTGPSDRHGQSIRAWVRSLTGVQKEGITLSLRSGRAWRFASDEGAHLGGADAAPNPLSYVAIGMAGSFMTELLSLARDRSITLREPRVTVENFYFRDGSFPRGTMVSGALPPEVSLDCDSASDPETLHRLLIDAVAASPLNGLVRDEKVSHFALVHNGRRIAPGEVSELGGDVLPDPGEAVSRLVRPAASRAPVLARKTASEEEMARRIAEAPPQAPVVDGDKKLLHLRTQCRLNEDGSYRVLREQFAQSSSSWAFTIDDRTTDKAVAPDSASCFAIGVAFCFMTQVGRFSNMAKHPLTGYRVVQDLHFTLGGASAGTGLGGTADPVETHVFLDTGAGDDTARKIVRVAERTCFLHALCRDRAKVRVRRAAPA